MNFQTLLKIEKPQTYIDIAFRSAKKEGILEKQRVKGERLERDVKVERKKFSVVRNTLKGHLMHILKSFPSIDSLDPFYNELIKITLDYVKLKKALGSLNWAIKRMDSFHSIYDQRLKGVKRGDALQRISSEYYGRMASVIKQIRLGLDYLEGSRRIMKRYPAIKTSIRTVAIIGFPNVGKTTLLDKLSGSRPEISNYAFTTKEFNLGYMMKGEERIQLIDTPGTLNRHDRMNDIERLSDLAVRKLADKCIYVLDLTGGYSIEDQLRLLKMILKRKLDIIVYYSKSDLFDEAMNEDMARYKSKYHGTHEIAELVELI